MVAALASAEIKNRFPEVIFQERDPDRCSYWMPHYNFPSLRKLILLDEVSLDIIGAFLDKILRFVFDDLYVAQGPAPSNFLETAHFDRVLSRLTQMC